MTLAIACPSCDTPILPRGMGHHAAAHRRRETLSDDTPGFLWRLLVSPEVVIRAVAYQPELTKPAAEAMGVSVRTIQRWAAKARADGFPCDCECRRCLTVIHGLRRRCYFCERNHPEGQDEERVAAL